MKVSIKYKIVGWFSLLFFLALVVLIYFTNTVINRNNEYVIKKEIVDLKKHSDIYIKQLLLSEQDSHTEGFIENNREKIVEQLSYRFGNRVVLYSNNGDFIIDSSQGDSFISGDNEDLSLAKQGEVAYCINYNKKNVTVNFSYVIKLNNKDMGIVRYIIDYSDLYKTGYKLINLIEIFSLILFMAILIVGFIISKGITVPIERLTNLTKKISGGRLEVDEVIKTNDEIGELYKNFYIMTDKLKMQIDRIQRDRDSIKELEGHRKTFFDNVTHELKTPLTTILGYAEVIKENGFNNDEDFFYKGMDHIIDESERLRRMVIGLLEFSQLENEHIEDSFTNINLSELLNSTCEEMQIKGSRYNIKIKENIESNILLLGNKDKLKQVIINIIDNSIKYGAENSIINVIAECIEDKIKITIKDRGKGIPKDKLQYIFEPFYRIDKFKSREKGSRGLGLAISKGIIERHGGNISIESFVNQGTTVFIQFKKA